MKFGSKIRLVMSAVTITAMLAAAPAFAGDTKKHNKNMDKMGHKMKRIQSMDELGPVKGPYAVLGTNFIGKEIENLKGEDVGEVEDIIIDSNGKVRYVAVSYGGFLGLDEKLFAVPMEAFQFQKDSDFFYDDIELILNVSKEQLEGDEGFDRDHWPDLEDENYRRELDTRYKVDRPHMD